MKYTLTIKCESSEKLHAISNAIEQQSNKLPNCKSRINLIRDIRNLFRLYDGQEPTLLEIKNLVYKHVN